MTYIRKQLVVRGYVQGVGYRAYIMMVARRLNLRGKVRNLKDGSVEIIVNVPNERILEEFKKRINVKAETPFDPIIEKIEVKDYEGEEELPEIFKIDYGYEASIAEKELLERSEMGIIAFTWMGKYLGEKNGQGICRDGRENG